MNLMSVCCSTCGVLSYPAIGVWLTLPMISSHEMVDEDVKRSIEHKLVEKDILAEKLTRGGNRRGGWKGGAVWLVPTYKRDIAEWRPVARRSL
jgi:hypothetical protein